MKVLSPVGQTQNCFQELLSDCSNAANPHNHIIDRALPALMNIQAAMHVSIYPQRQEQVAISQEPDCQQTQVLTRCERKLFTLCRRKIT